eukprot:CAMPEP_0175138704 /NCGR_PEP_ID=MMETSP0087-20121206/10499_1 /TAXON_ID=136419 /ORGANISM="Unknown Unknown, Strain D1" /LENGTH=82 /DNA_ID=CAMNT_0016421641 /DNA_START=1 /DNA_END=245 /DNA_ORIENTATION=-
MEYAVHPQGDKAQTASIATKLNNIGQVYRDLGRNKEALEKFEAVLQMLQVFYPGGHPHIDSVKDSIRIVEQKLARFERVRRR